MGSRHGKLESVVSADRSILAPRIREIRKPQILVLRIGDLNDSSTDIDLLLRHIRGFQLILHLVHQGR